MIVLLSAGHEKVGAIELSGVALVVVDSVKEAGWALVAVRPVSEMLPKCVVGEPMLSDGTVTEIPPAGSESVGNEGGLMTGTEIVVGRLIVANVIEAGERLVDNAKVFGGIERLVETKPSEGSERLNEAKVTPAEEPLLVCGFEVTTAELPFPETTEDTLVVSLTREDVEGMEIISALERVLEVDGTREDALDPEDREDTPPALCSEVGRAGKD